MGIFPGALAHLDEQDDEQKDEQEEDDAAGPNGGEHGQFGAEDAARVARGARLVLINVVYGEK